MNKFKKIMLGALSVLTLGLFVATGAKVNAGTNYDDYSISFSSSGQTYKIGDAAAVTKSKYDDDSITITSNFKDGGSLGGGKFTLATSSSNMKCETNGLKFQNTDTSLSFVVSEEAESITITLYIGSSGRSMSIYRGGTASTNLVETWNGDGTTKTKVFTYTAAGTYYIKSGCTSAVYTQSVSVKYKTIEDKSNYSVSYDVNGGTGTYQSKKYAVADYTTFTLPSEAPTKTGYTFGGWSDGTSVYAAGATYTFDTETFIYTFTAQWTANTYTVTYNANGGSVENPSVQVTFGSAYSLVKPTPEDGKAFAGWYYSNSKVALTGTWNIADNISVVANYVDEIYPEQTNADYIINPSNMTAADITSNTQSGIFTLLASNDKKFTVQNNGKDLPNEDGSTLSLTKRIKFNGVSTCTSNSKGRVIQIDAPKAGKIKFLVIRGNDSNPATLKLLDSQLNDVDSKDALTSDIYYLQEMEISSAGTYYLTGVTNALNIHYLEFVEEATPAVTVTALQQEAVVGDVTYIRFVFIVSNDTTLTTAVFANKLTLILDDGAQTKTCSPKAYDKITENGNTYTATVKGATYSFDNSINTNDIYVVYVVGFTTANYKGHNVKASLTYNEVPYETSGFDFE